LEFNDLHSNIPEHKDLEYTIFEGNIKEMELIKHVFTVKEVFAEIYPEYVL
jgi:hypothetical protein